MRHLFTCTALVAVLAGTPVSASPALAPYTVQEGFESGSVGPWSSYPPSQDTAYDPTIWVKAAENGKALFREITPNYEADCLFGVRRKLNLYVDSGSELSFRAYLKDNRPVEGIRVKLGFADGTFSEKMVPLAATSTWTTVRISLAEFTGNGVPRRLDAVAVMAVCPDADPENLLRFGIDDFRINGFREQAWEFTTPQVHHLEEWTDAIAAVHYREGGSITIAGRPPFTPRTVLVRVNRAFTGDQGGIFSMKKAGDVWSVSIPITAGMNLGPGFWRATILTTTQSGETLSSTLVFLVKRADAPTENPRIFMGPGDAPKVLAKASSGRLKTVWESVQKSARSAREQNVVTDFSYNLDAYDEIYWLPTYSGYARGLRVPSMYVRNNGVVYGLSGDREAGDAASRMLLQLSTWPSFVHPHILNQGQFTYWPVGMMIGDLAIGYDMARSAMTPEDRATVVNMLYTKGITEVFKEYVRDNRVSSATSNWIGDVTGGGMLCALAVMNDLPEENLEPYFTGMLLKMHRLIENTFDRDGHYGEGYSYLNHALTCINTVSPALERTFGVELPEKMYRGYRFLLYQANAGSKRVYDYGDAGDRLNGFSNFSWMLAKTRDPHLKWLYDLVPGTNDVDLFFGDESIPSQSPDDLPKIARFRDTGTVVFRSGFAQDDFIFVFRCGAFYNHQHFDQGAFYLADHDEDFLVEAGRTDYYTDPWYQKLFIQSAGHNCILLDGDPESQRAGDLRTDVTAWQDHAAITDFFTFDGGGFVSGRLDPLYKGRIDTLRRSVLYLVPRTVILIDEAAGPHGVKTADLLFHAPLRDNLHVDGNGVTVTRPKGTLLIRPISPAPYRTELKKRPVSINEFTAENALTMKARGYLQLSANLGNSPLTLVNVLTTDARVVSGLNAEQGVSSTAFTYGGTRYVVNRTGGKPFSGGGVETDALVHAVRPDGFIAFRVSSFTRDGKMLFAADRTIDAELNGNVLRYAAPDGAMVTLAVAAKPKQVMVNGQRTRDWTYTPASGLQIVLTPGEGTVAVR